MKKFTAYLIFASASSLFALEPYDYRNTDVSGRTFTNSTGQLESSLWNNATAIGTTYVGSVLGANFTGANLVGANFTLAERLGYAVFSDAIVTGANFSGTDVGTAHLFQYSQSGKNKNLDGVNFSNIKGTIGVFAQGYSLIGVNFSDTTISSASFQNANLTNASFKNITWANYNGANFIGAILTGADFSGADINYSSFGSSFAISQLKSTTNYEAKIFKSITFAGSNFSNEDFSGFDFGYSQFNTQSNLSNVDFSLSKNLTVNASTVNGANFQNAYNITLGNLDAVNIDLRGSTAVSHSNATSRKNIIEADGKITYFSMTGASDNFSIRKYTPIEGGSDISAKFSSNASVSADASLTLEHSANVSVENSATLSFGNETSLLINTDKDGSTTFSVESGAGLTFANGAILTVNIIDANSALNVDGYKFAVMDWHDDSRIVGLNDFVIDETIFLTLNNAAYTKTWSYYIDGNRLFIETGVVPEPALCAVIAALISLALIINCRRKKRIS